MSGMVANRVVFGTLVALVVLGLGAYAQAASGPDSSSRATGISVSVPGGPSASAAGVSAPPSRSASSGGWSSADGAVSKARSALRESSTSPLIDE